MQESQNCEDCMHVPNQLEKDHHGPIRFEFAQREAQPRACRWECAGMASVRKIIRISARAEKTMNFAEKITQLQGRQQREHVSTMQST